MCLQFWTRVTVYTCSLVGLEHVPLPLSRLIVPLAETVHLRVTVYICSLVGLEQVPLPLSRLIVPLAETVHLIGQFVQHLSDLSDKSTSVLLRSGMGLRRRPAWCGAGVLLAFAPVVNQEVQVLRVMC
jgi:hypothetical protein